MSTVHPSTLFDFADQLALVSSEVLKFRIQNKSTLNSNEKSQLESIEIELDQATAQLRAKGIESLGMINEPQRREVEAATNSAKELLQKIEKFEKALNIANSVFELASALITGQPDSIVKALQTVKNIVNSNKT